MPSGKVKWFDADKGFGFLSQEAGEDVYVRSSALPGDVETLKPGQRVEFDMASGRRGPQALKVELVEPPATVSKAAPRRDTTPRRDPDELHGMIEDMITLIEATIQADLRRGRHPESKVAGRTAEVLRAVASELDR